MRPVAAAGLWHDSLMTVDGFTLAYDAAGSGPPVVLLHGWPGDRTDYRDLVPLLAGCRVVLPDLRGFGESSKHAADPAAQYSSAAQARSVAGLITSLGLGPAVVVGYDIGSLVAQVLARSRPELVSALVLTPPVPGAGARVFGPRPLREFWYQQFHRLPLSAQLIDGNAAALRAYLRYFWSHWSGPGFRLTDADLEHLVSVYGAPGAFTASIQWYRSASGSVVAAAAPPPEERLATPAVVLWPELDPLFPVEWSDRLDEYFSRARLKVVAGSGHFLPLENPAAIADEVHALLR